MRNLMKRVSVFMLTAMLCMLSLTTVFATETNAETKADHTYSIYQIFTGTVTEDGNLVDAKWGTAAKDQKVGTAVPQEVLAGLEAVAKLTDVEKYAEVEKYFNKEAEATAVKTASETETVVFDNLTPGYYVVSDEVASGSNVERNYYVVAVTKENKIEVKKKRDIPNIDKEVSDDEEGQEWGKTADHEINETFQFRLTVTVPATAVKNFEAYKLEIADTMSMGVTYDGGLVIKNGDATLTEDTYAVTSTVNADKTTSLTISIPDLFKTAAFNKANDTTLVVTYNAHLNADAQVQTAGSGDEQTTTNINKVLLKYSNDYESEGMGQTPEKYVWVFTYELPADKYTVKNGTDSPVEGAKFVLMNGDMLAVLDANDTFVRWAAKDEILKEGEHTIITTKIVDGKSSFSFKGLDAGTYVLSEVEAPAGYTKCDDIPVVISANHYVSGEKGEGVVKLSMSADGKDTTLVRVLNITKSFLPETGGIGTTIFYVVGGILVVVAGVALFFKKKVNN